MMKKTTTWSALLPGPALRSGAAAVALLAAMASAPAAWAHDCEVDGIYYNLNAEAQTASVTYYSSYNSAVYTGAVVIPEEIAYGDETYRVTAIGVQAFYGCSSLTEVTIPESVTVIGDYAFRDCSSLTEVTIPEGVTTIREWAFYECSSLTEAMIPEGVTTIGERAFEGCSSLTEATIPSSVTTISSRVFYGCSSLTEVTIPESVTSIGSEAFAWCSSLTEVAIPEGVTEIEGNMFYRCWSLTEVTIPESVTSIGQCVFLGCSSLPTVTIPNSVTTIGQKAFRECSSLPTVTIPEGVTTIEASTFYGCWSLTEVTIPESVTTIEEWAFQDCSSLTEVTIPASVTTIGCEAFFGCSSLQKIYCLNPTPPGVITFGPYSTSPFDSNTRGRVPLFVPAESVELYAATDPWSLFATIEAIAVEEPTLYVLTYQLDGEVYRTDTLAAGDSIVAPEVEAPEGYTFSGWEGLPETMPAEDVTVTGTFIVNRYVLTYQLDGEAYRTDTLAYGVTIEPAEAPEAPEGYSFSGWEGLPETMPAEDVTVTGSFIVNRYVLTYQLDGEAYRTDTLAYGATIEPAEAPEAPEGYSFSGWVGLPETMPAADVTVEGWFEVNYYTLTWMVDGEVYLTETLAYGAAIVAPEAPELEGYDFGGWMNVPATMPAHDLVIYSSFTTGVAALPADGAGRDAIYTLGGLKLGTTDLSTLPAGTYIVGGRKVMKR